MTTQNYSIIGLKDLLNDLENLSNCLTGIPREHITGSAYETLQEDQYNLIISINHYAAMLLASQVGDLPS